MKRVAIIGAVIGALVPLGFWIEYVFFGYMFDWETAVLWPSSIVLMGLETQQSFSVAAVVWIGSGIINVALYTVVAIFGYVLYRFVVKIWRIDQ